MNVFGSYQLERYEMIQEDGDSVEIDARVDARILYTEEGIMSVGFQIYKDDVVDHYFYMADYKLIANHMEHKVLLSSKDSEIGSIKIREVIECSDQRLVLRANENDKIVQISWKKINSNH
ncbi:MAG: hypothetical protein VX642_08080 [Bdellovibrionota bacterium]|nr:hypothetical protein [Bdellovibrionota bacterium]